MFEDHSFAYQGDLAISLVRARERYGYTHTPCGFHRPSFASPSGHLISQPIPRAQFYYLSGVQNEPPRRHSITGTVIPKAMF